MPKSQDLGPPYTGCYGQVIVLQRLSLKGPQPVPILIPSIQCRFCKQGCIHSCAERSALPPENSTLQELGWYLKPNTYAISIAYILPIE